MKLLNSIMLNFVLLSKAIKRRQYHAVLCLTRLKLAEKSISAIKIKSQIINLVFDITFLCSTSYFIFLCVQACYYSLNDNLYESYYKRRSSDLDTGLCTDIDRYGEL